MTYQEKYTWAFGVIAVVGYAVYLALVALLQLPYAGAMLGSIIGAVVAGILSGIVIAIVAPRDAGRSDQRDKEIDQFGERIGGSLVVVGGVTALVLAWLEVAPFWIANTLYLGFILSAVLATIAKLVAYRRGMG